jgi:cardiolipin synthase
MEHPMINPIKQSHTVAIDTPLPSAWLRQHDTRPEQREKASGVIWRTGPKGLFRDQLISAIDSAREVVLLASFLLSDKGIAQALLNASERKTRIYVLTASEARLGKLVDDDAEFEQRMVEEHKALLDRLATRVVLRTAGHLHAKFLIADPGSSEIKGFLSTANFNAALQDSVELGVKLTREQSLELSAWFNGAFWLESEHELVEKGRLAAVVPLSRNPAPSSENHIVGTANGKNSLRLRVLEIIEGAREYLWVSSYGLETDHAVVAAIEQCAQSGVSVTLLTRPRPAVHDVCVHLARAGVSIFSHDKLHAKAVVSDAGALVLTANLETNGLDQGFEVGVDLSHGAAHRELKETLMTWGDSFPWQFAQNAERSKHLGEICLSEEGLRTGIRQVEAEQVLPISPTYAFSILDLESAPQPDFPPPNEKGTYYQQVCYQWEILPPKLPAGAKERMETYEEEVIGRKGKKRIEKKQRPCNPRIYDHKGQTYVVLQNEAMLSKVEAQARKLQARVVLP